MTISGRLSYAYTVRRRPVLKHMGQAGDQDDEDVESSLSRTSSEGVRPKIVRGESVFFFFY